MPDSTIIALTSASSIDVANDLLIIEDVSVPETKKTTPNTLKISMSLNNVDNTSDVNKPTSTATQTALNAKVTANSAITAATKTKVTYDAKGLVTAGADLSASDIPTGINAANISSGLISNAEFDYLNGLSDNIQTQLNGKQQSLTLTTVGTSGAATLAGGTLNIPQYSAGASGVSQIVAGTNVTISPVGGTGVVTINATGGGGGGGGTVTSVSALTLGTTGTDLSSTVANSTTTPVITLNVPNASASNRGALTSTDWSTFNGKQAALVSGTNIKTINGSSVLGSGNLVVSGTPAGSTSEVQFNNAGAFDSDPNFIWDDTNKRLGLGIAAPLGILHLKVSAGATRQVMDGDAGQSKIITFRTAGLQRWGLYSNNVAESGANAGSNFVLRRYNDAGTLLGTPLEVNRATGVTKIGEGLDLNGSVLNNFIPNTAGTSANLTLNSTNASTYNSSVISLTGALTITFDASLPNGFNVTLIQLDAAISTIAGTGGLVIGNRQGHGKNNGQYSVVSIIKYTNVLAILGGDTSL
jgi:hypothetical protein